jgi:transcriptional regulator with XRE-family HTH domain
MTMLQAHSTTVKARLRETRNAAGLTTRDVAARVGVGPATVSRWENGEGEPSVSQFALWAAATGQPLELMIEGLEWCTPRDLNPEPTDSESLEHELAFWTLVDELVV